MMTKAMLLVGALAIAIATPAQTPKTDPGHNNPPPAGAILDLNGRQIPGVPSGNGTYQQYSVNFTANVANTAITFAFREDPAYISFSGASVTDQTHESSNLLLNGDFSGGTYTNNGNSSAPISWTFANQYGATASGVVQSGPSSCFTFAFCWHDGSVQAYDAISQTISTTVGDTYLITFYVADNSFCRTDGNAASCNFSDLSTNGDITTPSGNGINVTVYAQAGLPAGTQTGSTITPATLAQQFVFNSTPGQQVQFNFDYTTASNAGTVSIVSNTVPRIIDQGVSPSDYLTMVHGTALAETTCFPDPGQLDSTGAAACPEFTIQCTNDSSTVFAGDNCPQSTARNIFFLHMISTTAPIIPPGSAPTMVMGSDNWSPASACTFVGPEAGQLCPKSVATQFKDCCGGPGGTVKHSNSTFIGGCCEREWTTSPTIPLWSNNKTVPVSFSSVPPTIPIPNPNNWVAAPGQSVTFGFETLGTAPDPTFPIPGDTTVPNLPAPSGDPNAPCGSSTTPLNWGTPGTNPLSFTTSGNVTVTGEGAWEVHYFSTDCDDQEELVYTPNGANNWAMFKTAPFNVDLTPPTVTGLTLSTTTPLPGQLVTVTYACSDPLHPLPGGVYSGVATCGTHTGLGGVASTGPLMSTFTATGAGLQSYAVTAIDRAGNSYTTNAPYSVDYEFEGFFPPVANFPAINKIDERTVVLLIFQAEKTGDAAVNGLKLGPSNGGTGTVSISATNSNLCPRHVIANSIPIKSLFNSGLLNLGGGIYLFPWQTNLPRGACVDLSLNLGDGVPHQAIFQAQ